MDGLRKFIIVIFLFFLTAHAQANNLTEIWPGFTAYGEFENNKKLKYEIDVDTRVAWSLNQFRQGDLEGGIGYGDPAFTYWLGYTQTSTHSAQITGVDRVSRLWQQIMINTTVPKNLPLTLQTRLDEGMQNASSGLGIRLRQKAVLWFAEKNSQFITPEIFDEIFFNLTRPAWVQDNSIIDQNRLFLGVSIMASPVIAFDVGYMDQYQVQNGSNQNDNIFYVYMNLTIK